MSEFVFRDAWSDYCANGFGIFLVGSYFTYQISDGIGGYADEEAAEIFVSKSMHSIHI